MQESAQLRPSWGRRIAGIEGMRAVAAISVLAYHVGLMASDRVHLGAIGQIVLPLLGQGLPLFFVLSGFLLFRPFASCILLGKRLPSIRRYAVNRLIRIYPAYLVVFAFAALVMESVYIKGSTHGLGPDNIGRLTEPLKIIANALLIHMFIPQFVMSGLPVAWSLTAEISFYAAVPLSALLMASIIRKGTNKAVALIGVPAAFVSVGIGFTVWGQSAVSQLDHAARIDFAFGQTGSAVLLRSFLAQADLFAYGMAAAVVVVILDHRGVQRVDNIVKVVLLISAVGLVYGGMVVWRQYLSNLAGLGSALAVLAVVLPSSRHGGVNRIGSVLEWQPLRFLGTISYSVYLWHLPIIFWLITNELTVGDSTIGFFFNVVLVLGLVLPISTVTFFVVERPFMMLKKTSLRAPSGKPSTESRITASGS